MHLFFKLFILVKRSTCFGRSSHPSWGAQNCTYGNRRMSNSCCYLLLAGTKWNSHQCQTGKRERERNIKGKLYKTNAAMWYNKICCWTYSFELMMDGKTAGNVEHFTRINNLRNRCILLVVLSEYITMHGPVNIKGKLYWCFKLKLLYLRGSWNTA